MTTVLIANHKEENCGVQQFGKRVAEIAQKSTDVQYVYVEASSYEEFKRTRDYFKPEHIIYNWYPCTMTWLSDRKLIEDTEATHSFIFHDGNVRPYYDRYLFFGADDIFDVNHPNILPINFDKKVVLPRPLFEYNKELPVNKVTTIGSFGFGFGHKGFDTLTTLVNEQFDEAILNFQMPFAYFGDRDGTSAKTVAALCRSLNTNPGITLNITHDFRDTESMLDFLAGNDMNIFHYNSGPNHGVSSVLDYALSVRRPIAISNNVMFRHVLKDEIRIDLHSLPEILANDVAPLEEYYTAWSHKNYTKEMDSLFL